MTYTEFMRMFPDNDACLDYLKERFFPDGTACPKCGKASRFHRINGRSAYSCQYCGHHVYPTAGTIFHKSTTSLQLWFWAIFLMSATRCGISAKQLEREIGVTYKTAHRMFKQIRTLLGQDDDTPLTGEVEMDETYVGGKDRAGRPGRPSVASAKVLVFGMVERQGRVRATVVEDAKTDHAARRDWDARATGVDDLHGRVARLPADWPRVQAASPDQSLGRHLRGRERPHEHDRRVFRAA
jgi:transposase-like protein